MKRGQAIRFHVSGTPVTKGSAIAVMLPLVRLPVLVRDIKHLRTIVRAHVTQKHKDRGKWEKAVHGAAVAARDSDPLPGGFNVSLTFYLDRPAGHYGTGRNHGTVKRSAPNIPISHRAGDIDKLTRSVLDGLTGALWDDDKQVQRCDSLKVYATQGKPGVTIDAEYLGD